MPKAEYSKKQGGGRSPHPGQKQIPATPQAVVTDGYDLQPSPGDARKRVPAKGLDLKKAETGTSGV